METDGGMIVTDGPGGGAIAAGLGGTSATTVTAPAFLMPMPLRSGYGVKTYYKRGVMIFCNGGPSGQVPPYSAIDGNIDMLFNWIPWHTKNYDSHNWHNTICNNLELGPKMSSYQ